jgi:glycine cleavage system T protein (aminomethyltransferase)
MAQGLKKTTLHAAHRRAGAKMVEFAGWEMPVQYSGVIDEHMAVRQRAGLFDISHMGEVDVSGAGALEFCQRISVNDVSRMKVSQAQYNLLLNNNGGVVDDVIFYRLAEDRFLVCVNASNSDKDFNWMSRHGGSDVELANVSALYAQLALQGPLAEKILQSLTALDLAKLRSFHFQFADVASVRCLVSRTGYTGEDGFELYCDADAAQTLWVALLEAGAADGLLPSGLGARDTLRLEKGYPLYGHELDDTTTPFEAGLDWVVKFSKPVFVGREALLRQKSEGVQRRLVGLELLDPGIARSGYALYRNGGAVGHVTSGTRSPTLGKSIALGYVSREAAGSGENLEVEIRGRRPRAKIISLPFVRR